MQSGDGCVALCFEQKPQTAYTTKPAIPVQRDVTIPSPRCSLTEAEPVILWYSTRALV